MAVKDERVNLIIRCPSKKCKDNNTKEEQWFKSNCGHKAKIDAQCLISCASYCSWENEKIKKVDILEVKWDCPVCECCDKADIDHVAASLMKAVAKLSRALDNASKERRNVYSTIIDTLSDRM